MGSLFPFDAHECAARARVSRYRRQTLMVRSRAFNVFSAAPLFALSAGLIGLGLTGCTRSHDVAAGGFEVPIEYDPPPKYDGNCEEQIDVQQDSMPLQLECTGLYSDIKSKKLAKDVRPYTPAYKFWSDGAEKFRYVLLPDDEQIDTSDPRKWRFPVGTQFWKEFQQNDQRAETRLYKKVRSDRWVKTTYAWSESGKKATRIDSGMKMSVNGFDYEVPNAGTCDDCHDGSADNVLGFDMISLGLPTAEGTTLQDLVDDDLLSDPPEKTSLEIGDDGTGKAREVLGWLHINCGATCHNDGVNSKAEETDLRMKLKWEDLDGRAMNDTEVLKNLIGVPAKTTQWQDQKRIVPGKPEESLLYKLITTRLGVDGNKQMPPLVTRVVDEEHADMIKEWILALKPTSGTTAEGPQ